MRYVVVLSAFLLVGATALACSARRTRHFPSMRGEAVAFVEIPSDTYVELEPEVLAELSPSIQHFVLAPAALTLRVNQEYPLHALRIIAIDSLGDRLGQIARLEYTMTSDVARLTDHATILGVHEGDAVLVLRPRTAPALQHLGPLPEWRLPVRVRP